MIKKSDFQQEITTLLPEIDLRFAEPMSKHTSFRIGGPAEVMAFPKNVEELKKLLHTAKVLNCPLAIMGAGTNILAPDGGVSGLIICLKDCMDGIERVDDTAIRVFAGVTMARAAVFAAGQGLSGLEFAHGIPGTVGGAVYMNAGAYDGEISQVCKRVEVLTPEGNLIAYTAEQMNFSYRHSRLQEDAGIVISAVFSLEPKEQTEIRGRMQELMQRRKASQPLDMPSAGSAFKRPVGGYAAALIDNAGLKGFRIGNAAVSEKHAGFVVNLGDATAEDVKSLLQQVSQRVYTHSGIMLEPEIRIW